jgi:predicted nucleic acid-binding protein
VIVHLDTSALVGALAGSRPEFERLAGLLADGHRLSVSAIALYEWVRGPRSAAELDVQNALMPPEQVCPFGVEEAALAARLSQSLRRPRSRDLDLAIAACAMVQQATLWTLNRKDVDDIPGLRLL